MTLQPIVPPEFDVDLDIRYATSDNFTTEPVYSSPQCFLEPTATELLHKAIQLAHSLDLRIKIFDAFRPIEAQQKLWYHTPDPEFLSPPDTGCCPHCRGVAIDLTLLDKGGSELDMGTDFDEFTPLSHHGNTEISTQAQHNRFLLLGIMSAAGWDFYSKEWWHYQLFNPRNYPILSDSEAGTGMMESPK